MKNFKLSIAYLAMFAMIFTSCSKEEASPLSDQDTVQLTFGTLLNDLTRQAIPAECSDGDPSYVAVGITNSAGMYVGGTTTDVHWINIDLMNNNGSWETKYSSDLELPAGTYTLQHFIVYDDDDNVLWVAPRTGGTFATSVDNPLPYPFDLAPGTKPYIEVDVLCYVAREEAAYGYPFFEFDVTEVENSYCIFVNYCDDETGREYPANFRVQIWSDGYGGNDLVVNQTNAITMAGDWPSASALCVALPDLMNDTYYARVTVINHDWLNYTADASDYYEFEITQNDIDAQLTQPAPRYHHVSVNCGETTTPPQGCLPAPGNDCDRLSFDQTVDVSGFPPGVNPFYPLSVGGVEVGTIEFDLAANNSQTMDVLIDLFDGLTVTALEVSLPAFVDTQICVGAIDENEVTITYVVDDNDGISFPVDVEFDANICGTIVD